MSSLYVLISGFGTPHWDHKVAILKNNLERIHDMTVWKKIKVCICQYSDPLIYQLPNEWMELYDIEIIYEKGIVGEFIHRYATPSRIAGYDYILCLLDDIELQQIQWDPMIRYVKDLDFDLLSPSLSLDSKHQYKYMLHEPYNLSTIKVTSCCEYFCIFASTRNFKKYYDHVDPNYPWMWGLDLILKKYLGLKVGVVNTMVMKHWYKNESYQDCPNIQPMIGYDAIVAKYGETKEALAEQSAVLYYIVDPTNIAKPP